MLEGCKLRANRKPRQITYWRMCRRHPVRAAAYILGEYRWKKVGPQRAPLEQALA
jgi:hypothetical protein